MIQNGFFKSVALALFCVAASAAHAQSIVGSSSVEGRSITLFSDGTWAFTDRQRSDCKPVLSDLSFCGISPIWTQTPPPSAAIDAQFMRADTEFVQFISDRVGTAQGIEMDSAKAVILDGVAGITGVRVRDIPVLSDEPAEVDGKDAVTIAFSVTFRGVPVVFANTILLEESRLLQMQSYVIGATAYSDDHRALHATFLNLVEMD
ncbi:MULTISPECIES: hypothetical protein [Roseobacter]|uniref:Uncharacterized protein n=1 Tax=Roseobacter litoralis (strain ATCC 49566 / DSM 6996 / JCM 21268 / NBRC 15278 / OCh 149) TaxID=391595 RepID=F7ZK98_ROSLO|nr:MULTISPECIES: hypothetical protein [Roseobacter]AEI93917.1 hypothetical protein RLO149_c019310 [Roseobacter litoralis Och 149]GIT85850.1 hypothetical protein ROBYS_08660 [Roseobacter sp. OBYS 0001]